MPPPDSVLSSLCEQQAPHSHILRLRQLVALAESDPRLQAIALVGSYAKGVGDRISDLDLVVIAASGQTVPVLEGAHQALANSEVLNQFTGTHGSEGVFWKLVYLVFLSVEIHVFEPNTGFRLKRPYVSIWDPENLLANLVIDGAPIRHEEFAAYEFGDEGLFWELFDCIKWLSRGRTGLAKEHVRKIAMAMEAASRAGDLNRAA